MNSLRCVFVIRFGSMSVHSLGGCGDSPMVKPRGVTFDRSSQLMGVETGAPGHGRTRSFVLLAANESSASEVVVAV